MFWGLFCETWTDYQDVVHRLSEFQGKNGQGTLFGADGQGDTLRLQRLVRLKGELGKQLMSALRDCGLSPSQLDIEVPPSDPVERLMAEAEKRKRQRFFEAGPAAADPDDAEDLEDETENGEIDDETE